MWRNITSLLLSAAVIASAAAYPFETIAAGNALKAVSYAAGDVNSDGFIDARDATIVLANYSAVSTGTITLTEEEKALQDLNDDGMTDARDATIILRYYAYTSTGGELALKEFIKADNNEPATSTTLTSTAAAAITTTTAAVTEPPVTSNNSGYAYGTIVDYDLGRPSGPGWVMVIVNINPDGSKSYMSMANIDYQLVTDYFNENGWPTEDHYYYIYIG